MANFVDMIVHLEMMGLSDVILPFFLVFTIVFAILSKTKILGPKPQARRFDVIISLIMAFAVIIPHVLGRYPPGGNIVLIINDSLPQIAIVIVAIIMLLLMIGAFGVRFALGGSPLGSIWVIASLIIVVFIFGQNAGWWYGTQLPWFLYWLSDPYTQSMIVALLVFGIIIWFVTRDPDTAKKEEFSKRLTKWVPTSDWDDDAKTK